MAVDTFQLIALGLSGGEYWEFVQHFKTTETNVADPVAFANDLIDAFRDQVEGAFLDCVPSQVTITGYKAKRINNDGGPTTMLPITPVAGARTGNLAVGCLGPCIVSPYFNNTRWTTGRLFLPGIVQGDIASNHIAGSLVTAVQDLCDLLAAVITGENDWYYTIWSKKLELPFEPFDVEISLKVGVQKRRLLPVI